MLAVDEVGYGACAGPVVSCAVFTESYSNGCFDSKKYTKKVRNLLFEEFVYRYRWRIGWASVDEIARLGIRAATNLCIQRAVSGFPSDEHIMMDGIVNPMPGRKVELIKGGDACIAEIGIASIIAKVIRDNYMISLSKTHPEYGWEQNSGYGTKKHFDAVRIHGMTAHHRKEWLAGCFV